MYLNSWAICISTFSNCLIIEEFISSESKTFDLQKLFQTSIKLIFLTSIILFAGNQVLLSGQYNGLCLCIFGYASLKLTNNYFIYSNQIEPLIYQRFTRALVTLVISLACFHYKITSNLTADQILFLISGISLGTLLLNLRGWSTLRIVFLANCVKNPKININRLVTRNIVLLIDLVQWPIIYKILALDKTPSEYSVIYFAGIILPIANLISVTLRELYLTQSTFHKKLNYKLVRSYILYVNLITTIAYGITTLSCSDIFSCVFGLSVLGTSISIVGPFGVMIYKNGLEKIDCVSNFIILLLLLIILCVASRIRPLNLIKVTFLVMQIKYLVQIFTVVVYQKDQQQYIKLA